MAKSKSKKTVPGSDPVAPETSRNWAPAVLIAALKAGRRGTDRIAALKRSGILTKQGKLSKRYKNWGRNVTHTSKGKKPC